MFTSAIPPASIISKLPQLLPNVIPWKLTSVSLDASILSLPSLIMVQSSALASSVATSWETIAKGNGPSEQAFAIMLGYIAICGFAMLFLSSGIVFPGAARAVRNLITQQLIVVKVQYYRVVRRIVLASHFLVRLLCSLSLSLWSSLSDAALSSIFRRFPFSLMPRSGLVLSTASMLQ